MSEYEAGDVLGEKYRLLREAGGGAMGTVWVALNTALECEVAIKLLRSEVRLPVMFTRLLREARAAAKLSHSAIVRVFDLGQTSQGDPYIVMELIEGESLADLLRREKRLAPEWAVQIILPVVRGMRAAHDRGIIHRDLKPDNIVLAKCDDGRRQPKIIDFGIAKLRSSQDVNNTGAFLLGTPDYMSPEQAAGAAFVDHRTDIWSLCAMLYELLAGEVPFGGGSTDETLFTVAELPAESLEERGFTDGALWQIVERGLRKDPDERWQTMTDLYAALAEWLTARGVLVDVSGAALRAEHVEAPEPLRTLAPVDVATHDDEDCTPRSGSRRWRLGVVAVGAMVAAAAAFASIGQPRLVAGVTRWAATSAASATAAAYAAVQRYAVLPRHATAAVDTERPPTARPRPAVGTCGGEPTQAASDAGVPDQWRGAALDGSKIDAGKVPRPVKRPTSSSTRHVHVSDEAVLAIDQGPSTPDASQVARDAGAPRIHVGALPLNPPKTALVAPSKSGAVDTASIYDAVYP